jgi:hypothetical protein
MTGVRYFIWDRAAPAVPQSNGTQSGHTALVRDCELSGEVPLKPYPQERFR